MFEALGATFGATLAGCLALVGTTGAAVYFFLRRRKTDSEQMNFEQLQSVIYEDIRDVCELALVRENFKSVVSVDVDKKLPFFGVHIPGTSRKFLMDYSGTIVCGFDLTGVNISRDGNKVNIVLPQSRIMDIYADVNSFNIHMQDAGLLAANIKIEEQNEWVAADVDEHGRRAIQKGLLHRANENARQLLLSRIEHRGLDRNFDIQIITSGNVPALNAP